MTNTVEVTLKPCPFCGHDDPLFFTHSSDAGDEYSVRCYNGCCEVGDEYKAEAITAWNTRHEATRLRAENERLQSLLRSIDKRCTELRGGTDDWFELVEFQQVCRQALQETDDE